ncbi:MAG: glycerol-3-phosphate ABC transporter ATP-binding protein [Phycisphaeraceae bacterium]|nr:glycerol-3-phosphate ABC transporter ATP-binding protein [Phycisphaeraceae bacterium]
MAEVKIESVGKIYPGNVRAVKDVNINIRDGEFLVLVGPSGCGKSTTLRMVAGLEEISEGTITIGERVVNDVPPKDRDIAMVFQNYALYPHMTVYKNMAFGLKLRGFKKAEIDQRVRDASAILGLDEFLDRKPKALSGGQRQRVALGRAIVRQPSAFLFDEPLSNLDAKLRVTTRAELKHLHHRLKTTTIYVTHDQEEAMTLGDRVCVMDIGLVQQIDTPMNIYNYPVNRFVAGFMGMPPMNFIEGKLNQDGEAVFFEGEGLAIRLTDVVAGRVMGHIGKDVILGLRPEAMRLRKEPGYGEGDNQTFEAKVDVVEPLGKEMDAYLETSKGKRIIARIPAEELEHDINVTMHVSASRLHIFEPGAHGLNISLPQEQIAAATVG